jgi:hypothetical protein
MPGRSAPTEARCNRIFVGKKSPGYTEIVKAVGEDS